MSYKFSNLILYIYVFSSYLFKLFYIKPWAFLFYEFSSLSFSLRRSWGKMFIHVVYLGFKLKQQEWRVGSLIQGWQECGYTCKLPTSPHGLQGRNSAKSPENYTAHKKSLDESLGQGAPSHLLQVRDSYRDSGSGLAFYHLTSALEERWVQ